MNKYYYFLIIIFIIGSSCSVEEENIINYPSISIMSPNQEMYEIGQDIPIEIFISHNEVLDNITYYETCDCTGDDYDSLDLIELNNIYQEEWSYVKTISTKQIPADIMCNYNIEITANDLNGNESSQSIYFHVMTMTNNM